MPGRAARSSLAAALGAVLITGCGGGAPTETRTVTVQAPPAATPTPTSPADTATTTASDADAGQQGDALCKQFRAQIPSLHDPESLDDLASKADTLRSAIHQLAGELDQVGAEGVKAYAQKLRAEEPLLQRVAASARAADTSGVRTKAVELQQVGATASAAAGASGLPHCQFDPTA